MLEDYLDMNVSRNMKKVMVIGDRKTGKSTLSHYISNIFLERGKKESRTFFIETDLGQPTLSPPGFISCSLLDSPLITNSTGWTQQYNFSLDPKNLNKIQFVGDYSPEFIPSLFKTKIKKLIEDLETKISKLEPKLNFCIINTPGYIKDLGKFITLDMIEIIKPDIIIYLQKGPAEKNRFFKNLKEIDNRKIRELKKKGQMVGTGILPILKINEIIPEWIKNRSRLVKKSRDLNFMNFFRKGGSRFEIEMKDMDFWIIDEEGENKKELIVEGNQLFDETEEDENFGLMEVMLKKRDPSQKKKMKNFVKKEIMEIALVYLNSICSVEYDGRETLCLIEDFDLKASKIQVIIPRQDQKYLKNNKENGKKFKILKSPLMSLNTKVLKSFINYDEELNSYGKLGQRIYWLGPDRVAVGEKPSKKVVSLRKNLLKT
jgi:hypothetical protein